MTEDGPVGMSLPDAKYGERDARDIPVWTVAM